MRLLFLSIFILSSCNSAPLKTKTVAEQSDVRFESILDRNDVIWGFDFLPDGKVILSERSGKMILFNPTTKKVVELTGLPKIYVSGQAGLLDVRVHPEFSKNQQIYFTYSEPVGEKSSTTALGLATLSGEKLINVKKLFSGKAANENDIHYGSRIEFDFKGHLFITMGDRDERNHAQSLEFHQGKILRLNLDGSVPKDNPFAGNKMALPEIWTLGHRSPQGLALHPETGDLWEAEMGPKGGDEINLIAPKKNYGWPLVTYGKEYWGPKIGNKEKSGYESPITYWVPSISPSAMTFYTGDKFPTWKNNIFLATLSGTHIHRIVMNGKKVEGEEQILNTLEYRWRSLRTGPDGFLYLGTDEGKFGRLIAK